mmetsp:Transcript_29950/g.55690  ORF Transcript_29950/g.55690 Transcript_29950/m.55690 type:complete len:337 (-) Transcript_29950:875-1885(-)
MPFPGRRIVQNRQTQLHKNLSGRNASKYRKESVQMARPKKSRFSNLEGTLMNSCMLVSTSSLNEPSCCDESMFMLLSISFLMYENMDCTGGGRATTFGGGAAGSQVFFCGFGCGVLFLDPLGVTFFAAFLRDDEELFLRMALLFLFAWTTSGPFSVSLSCFGEGTTSTVPVGFRFVASFCGSFFCDDESAAADGSWDEVGGGTAGCFSGSDSATPLHFSFRASPLADSNVVAAAGSAFFFSFTRSSLLGPSSTPFGDELSWSSSKCALRLLGVVGCSSSFLNSPVLRFLLGTDFLVDPMIPSSLVETTILFFPCDCGDENSLREPCDEADLLLSEE